MTRTARRTLLYVVIVALAGIVLCVAFGAASAAPADTCDPAYTAQCCACEPSEAAEPTPLPRIYLPVVLQRLPPMSCSFESA